MILAIIGGSNILLMPANGGRLTVAEFAENFNQMAQVTDSPLRLHSNGAWVRDSLRGYAATLENAFPSRLKYETDANGYLTAVRFRCSYTAQGGGDPVSYTHLRNSATENREYMAAVMPGNVRKNATRMGEYPLATPLVTAM